MPHPSFPTHRLRTAPSGRRLAVAAAVLLSAATVAGAEWREIGSGLPRTMAAVTSLAIDPATPSTLYAVEAGGRLFQSIDSGGSWKLRGSVAGVSFVAVDPTNSSTIYAATQRGVLKSGDGGETWAGANSGLPDNGVSMIAIDPLTPATLYAASIFGVFKSTDAARSWNKLDSVPPEAYASNFWITIDSVSPSTVYLQGNSILKSADGGQSWTTLYKAPAISPYGGLVVDPIDSSTLYATSYKFDGSILKSTDGGQTWTAHSAAPPRALVSSFGIDPATPSTVYAVYLSDPAWGILKSMDSGESWTVLDTGLPQYSAGFPLLAVSPTTPATVYAGYFYRQLSGGHLAKSTDGGASWNAADARLSFIDVQTVAIDPVFPSDIYAGMGGAASGIPLFQSADGGASWKSLAQFQLSGSTWYGSITCLLVGSPSRNAIYAAASSADGYHRVFKTKDGGANWLQSGPDPFESQIATVMVLDAAGSNTIYLGDYVSLADGAAILYKSFDDGSTWPNSVQWDIGPLNALVIDPGDRATLYVGTPEGVFKTANGGASWSNVGLSMGVTSLALDPGDPTTIYAAAGAGYFGAGFLGMFKSTDGGASWVPIDNGLAGALDSRSTVTAIAFAPDRSALYAATSGHGVYTSLDGGATWGPLNEGLTNLDVRLLAVASNALYAVTSSGIFQSDR